MAKLAAYSDGSLENDLPMQQLSELFNVNHFVVSQVNPHSAIFSSLAMKATVWSHPVYGAIVGYLRFLTAQCRDWLKNIVDFFIFRSKSPVWSARRGLTQTLTQDYEGRENDVTIMPWAGHISPFKALTLAIRNPGDEEFDEVVRAAERNTFPMIPRIKAHCLIETTLDKCVQRLRKRLTDETVRSKEKEYEEWQRSQQQQQQPLGGRRMDRTPSFYTTRSIVNLSGLSVSDPLPVPLPVPSHTLPLPQHHHNQGNETTTTSLQGVFPVAGDVASTTASSDAGTPTAASSAAADANIAVPQPVLVAPRPVHGRRQISGRVSATPPPAHHVMLYAMDGQQPQPAVHRPMSMPTPPPNRHHLMQRSRSNSICKCPLLLPA